MYRVVQESYENYIKDFYPEHINDHRYKIAKPLKLLFDLELYEVEKNKQGKDYKKISHMIYLLNENIDKYQNFKSFLWSLESRNIYGYNYEILDEAEFNELTN